MTPAGVGGASLAVAAAHSGQAPSPAPLGRLGSAEQLATVRQSFHVEGARLREVRKEADVACDERVDGRVLDLLVQELTAEFSSSSEPRPPPSVASRLSATSASTAEHRAQSVSSTATPGARGEAAHSHVSPLEAIQEVIERITFFMGDARPQLALSVKGQLGADVLVERTGANEVAIRVKGHRGPPAPEVIALVREELQSRGIRLSSLSLA